MKKKMILLLGFAFWVSIACNMVSPPQPAIPTSAPALNTPVPQQPATQFPTSPPATPTVADSSAYLVQLDAGTAYDLDTFAVVQNTNADFLLDMDAGLMQPQNGAQMSGYADLSPFEKSECQAAVMSTDPLAWQTDLYTCFQTNQGRYGYIVVREAADDAIWFDVYLFP